MNVQPSSPARTKLRTVFSRSAGITAWAGVALPGTAPSTHRFSPTPLWPPKANALTGGILTTRGEAAAVAPLSDGGPASDVASPGPVFTVSGRCGMIESRVAWW
eukprot:130537-Chlamydomonas_euryale.AAC.1